MQGAQVARSLKRLELGAVVMDGKVQGRDRMNSAPKTLIELTTVNGLIFLGFAHFRRGIRASS